MDDDLKTIHFEQASQFLHILAVIDTNFVKKTYPNPSQSPHNPTGISSDAAFMINNRAPGVSSSEGTGTLGLKLNIGDRVALMGTSLSDNSGDAAIVYSVRHFSGDPVFNPFAMETIEQAGAETAAETPKIIPVSAQSQVFYSFNSIAKSRGYENLATIFALYTRAQSKKTLYGYFYWIWRASAP